MKVWTNNKFKGRHPVGSAAVVVAENKTEAVRILNVVLVDQLGLSPTSEDEFEELPTKFPLVRVLVDGDY